MRKALQSFRFLITALVISVITLVLSFNTWAEEESPQDKVAQLESQVKELLDFKQQIQNYNPNISPVDDFKNADPEPQQLGGDGTPFPPARNCVMDYSEWPSSDIYKRSDWAMEDMLNLNPNTMRHEDVNGDGLMDYVYSNNTDVNIGSCLHLNNGRGWDLVYKCYGKKTNNIWTFYGDCAKTD